MYSLSQVFQIMCVYLLLKFEKKVKLIIFSQITASEESSRKKVFFVKASFYYSKKYSKQYYSMVIKQMLHPAV